MLALQAAKLSLLNAKEGNESPDHAMFVIDQFILNLEISPDERCHLFKVAKQIIIECLPDEVTNDKIDKFPLLIRAVILDLTEISISRIMTEKEKREFNIKFNSDSIRDIFLKLGHTNPKINQKDLDSSGMEIEPNKVNRENLNFYSKSNNFYTNNEIDILLKVIAESDPNSSELSSKSSEESSKSSEESSKSSEHGSKSSEHIDPKSSEESSKSSEHGSKSSEHIDPKSSEVSSEVISSLAK
jgi:hypothetical protein